MRYKIDKVSEGNDGVVVYVQILDQNGAIIGTKCIPWKDKEQFKEQVRLKTAKLREAHESVESKKIEIQKSLDELEDEK